RVCESWNSSLDACCRRRKSDNRPKNLCQSSSAVLRRQPSLPSKAPAPCTRAAGGHATRTTDQCDELAPSHLPPLRLKATDGINPHEHSGRGRADAGHVRFGSKADICTARAHVRFTPNCDRESRHPQPVMSALPPKADMCSALGHVC